LTYSLPLLDASTVLANFKAIPVGNVRSASSVLVVSFGTCDLRRTGESSSMEEYERLRRLLCVKDDVRPRTKDDSATRDISGVGR